MISGNNYEIKPQTAAFFTDSCNNASASARNFTGGGMVSDFLLSQVIVAIHDQALVLDAIPASISIGRAAGAGGTYTEVLRLPCTANANAQNHIWTFEFNPPVKIPKVLANNVLSWKDESATTNAGLRIFINGWFE